ncbi:MULTISPECIES: response regulator [unclassified Sphingomonas]|uniref:response regulator n=1 Tax=unclassified Sphingomonas TaxID=196159 RepID=UPI00082E0EF3|nr:MULTISPECIES: response regulator [unclassified Sphingomonas]
MAYIIVADDDPLLEDLVSFKLEAAGHHVLTVADGQAAIDALADEPLDMLVLAAMMPVLSGRQVLQRIRAEADGLAVWPRDDHVPERAAGGGDVTFNPAGPGHR